MHGGNECPLVCLGLVPLRCVKARLSVKTPHGVEEVVENGDADVAAPRVHGGNLLPCFAQWVEPLDAAEVIHAVKSPDDVDKAVKISSAVIGKGAFLLARDVHPLVCPGIVGLDGVGWAPPAPASDSKQDGAGQARTGEQVGEIRKGLAIHIKVVHFRQGFYDESFAFLVVLHVLVCFDIVHEIICVHQCQSHLTNAKRRLEY